MSKTLTGITIGSGFGRPHMSLAIYFDGKRKYRGILHWTEIKLKVEELIKLYG